MTADERALLRAVIAAPDDDTPRLVYADWLDERGGEAEVARAEFIRCQCWLISSRGEAEQSERARWQRRQNALLREWSDR